MTKQHRIAPSASMIVACVALFVALGGVGYAAATINSAQIQNNAIKSVDIKNRGIAKKDLSRESPTPTSFRMAGSTASAAWASARRTSK